MLLDEIAVLSCELQFRLLRVLDPSRFFRVGGMREIKVDVRLIAATNRCPMQAVKLRRLREDLLYRLQVVPIELPPLVRPKVKVADGAIPVWTTA